MNKLLPQSTQSYTEENQKHIKRFTLWNSVYSVVKKGFEYV